jgi:hypothetical protein
VGIVFKINPGGYSQYMTIDHSVGASTLKKYALQPMSILLRLSRRFRATTGKVSRTRSLGDLFR